MSGRLLGAIYAADKGVDASDAEAVDRQNKVISKVTGPLVDNTIGRVPGVGDVVSATNTLFDDAFFPDWAATQWDEDGKPHPADDDVADPHAKPRK